MAAHPSRRAVIRGLGVAAGASALAACSDKKDSAQQGPGTISKADVPVDGGAIIAGTYWVVTQPTPGTYKGFTRVCPHAGCLVTSVSGGHINCPCHGSQFSITDGSPTHGPATSSLTEGKVTQSGDQLTVND